MYCICVKEPQPWLYQPTDSPDLCTASELLCTVQNEALFPVMLCLFRWNTEPRTYPLLSMFSDIWKKDISINFLMRGSNICVVQGMGPVFHSVLKRVVFAMVCCFLIDFCSTSVCSLTVCRVVSDWVWYAIIMIIIYSTVRTLNLASWTVFLHLSLVYIDNVLFLI
jgi:hypothetical protein